jgi:hypothetical protein
VRHRADLAALQQECRTVSEAQVTDLAAARTESERLMARQTRTANTLAIVAKHTVLDRHHVKKTFFFSICFSTLFHVFFSFLLFLHLCFFIVFHLYNQFLIF